MSIARGRTKPKPTSRQGISLTPRQRMLKGSGVSWWTAFAQGDRRDAEFAAEVDRRCPGSITRREMGPTLTPWADEVA